MNTEEATSSENGPQHEEWMIAGSLRRNPIDLGLSNRKPNAAFIIQRQQPMI
jgi:hypothetical protein